MIIHLPRNQIVSYVAKILKKYGRQVRHPPGARNCGFFIFHLINNPQVVYPEVVEIIDNE